MIKKCKISVDRKKYTKNEIKISDRYMFISYSKPGGYDGKIITSMKNPSEQVSKIEYDGANKILSFQWQGPWEDYKTGKESETTLQFKIEFERTVDGDRAYFALIKKLPLKKGRHSKRNPAYVRTNKKQKKTKKKGRKGPEESATEFSVGEERRGNDGNMWVIQVSKNGIQRWTKKEDKSARGKNKPLEKLWTDMSNMKKLVFIMKYKQLDGSYYKIHKIKPSEYQDRIDKAVEDDSVKVILTAGNSFDGYQQLYDDVGKSSVEQVLKNYKKYWRFRMDDKLYTC